MGVTLRTCNLESVQKFGHRMEKTGRRPATNLPVIVLMDETVAAQRGKEFTLFATVDLDRPNLLHAGVAPSRTYLPTRWFLEESTELYGRSPLVGVIDGPGMACLRPHYHHYRRETPQHKIPH